jgi:hypothetical protein
VVLCTIYVRLGESFACLQCRGVDFWHHMLVHTLVVLGHPIGRQAAFCSLSIYLKYGNQRWLLRTVEKTPKFNAEDGYFQLSRSEQVKIIRLRTDHNKIRYHLHTKFKIGTTRLCHSWLAKITVKHVLHDCPQFTDLWNETWHTHVELGGKTVRMNP